MARSIVVHGVVRRVEVREVVRVAPAHGAVAPLARAVAPLAVARAVLLVAVPVVRLPLAEQT